MIWTAAGLALKWAGLKLLALLRWAFANPVAAGFLILLVACGWLWHEKRQQAAEFTAALQAMTADRDNERARADKAIEGRDKALAANATLAASVTDLEAANQRATALADAAKAAGAAALANLRRARADLAASHARESALRSTLYAQDPDVAAWGAQPVPRALAARLLESARQTAGP